jgi:hypothetical protein
MKVEIKHLVKEYGQPYSEMLGINLRSGKNSEIVKWFFASILYAKPIQEKNATKTYKIFAKHGMVSARKIVKAGWHKLVDLLDAGGYTRYDYSTADKLLEVFGNLQKQYACNLNKLHALAKDSKDLENRLKALGKGIGDVTVSIFLRDMRVIWKKADPKPTPLVELAAKKLRIKDLKKFAKKNKIDLVRLETALLRFAKNVL